MYVANASLNLIGKLNRHYNMDKKHCRKDTQKRSGIIGWKLQFVYEWKDEQIWNGRC